MTDLFPRDDLPITVKQGRTGDCYLIAVLDSLFNTEGGRAAIKSLFSVNVRGEVVLTIKRNSHSVNITGDKLARARARYSFRQTTTDDIFTFTPERLEAMDSEAGPLESNSMAVKILERIVAYYFLGDTLGRADRAPSSLSDSIVAHNNEIRYRGDSASLFLGEVLGIAAHDTKDVNHIISLKLRDPGAPVYISLDYDGADSRGRVHGYHALRVASVVSNGPSDYTFTLVNPWDNQKTETRNLAQLTGRRVQFCQYSLNEPRYQLTQQMLTYPVDDCKYILSKPEFTQMLAQINARMVSLYARGLSLAEIQSFITLHKQMPTFLTIFNELELVERVKLIRCVNIARGDLNEFMKLFMRDFIDTATPRWDVVEKILKQPLLPVVSPLDSADILLKLAVNAKIANTPVLAKFESVEFFNLVMKAAIQHNTTFSDPKQEVERQLFTYYFADDVDRVTRKGCLRHLFIQNIFEKSSIIRYFEPQIFFTKSLAKYFTDFPSIEAQRINDYLKSNPFLITEELGDKILIESLCKNPRQLFEKLYQLSLINPGYVDVLLPLAVKKVKTSSDVFKSYAHSVSLTEPSEFKKWFIALTSPSLIERDMMVIQDHVDQISKFAITFSSVTTKTGVDELKTNLIANLKLIITSPACMEAQRNLGVATDAYHPLILKAYTDKVSKIEEAAIQQTIVFDSAEGIILDVLERVKRFHVRFMNDQTPGDVRRTKDLLLAALNNIVDSDEVLKAQKNLDTVDIRQSTQYIAKVLEINRAADEQQRALNVEAQNVLANYVTKILALSTINTGQSTYEIRIIKERLHNELDELVRSVPVVRAQQTLALDDSTISSAHAVKALEINKAADMQERNLNSEAQAVLTQYLAKIHDIDTSFYSERSIDDVMMKKASLLEALENLLINEHLKWAQEFLGFTNVSIEIAYQEKIQKINTAAQQQERILANEVVEIYVERINNLLVDFDPVTTASEAREHQVNLKNELFRLSNSSELITAQRTLGYVIDNHPQISIVISDTEQKISSKAMIINQVITSRNQAAKIIADIDFKMRLQVIEEMKSELENKALKDDNYLQAAEYARNLYKKIYNATNVFLTSSRPLNENLREFKSTCLSAIEASSSVLEKHRGWGEVLAMAANVLVSLATLGLINMAIGRWGLFTVQTRSAQTVKEFSAVVENIAVSA